MAAFGNEVRSIKMPEPGVPAYHLYLTDGEAFLSVDDYRVIDEWGPRDRVMSFLFDLHAHLMAGERGERIGGWISLLGVLLSVTGLVLWWPTRAQFRWRNLLPSGWSRRKLIAWHRDLGLIGTPILLVLLLSGSGLVFYETAGALLNGMFGDPPVRVTTPTSAEGPEVVLADQTMLARVDAEFPDARLVFYYPPAPGAGYNEFRLQQPCELHPNGRSFLYLDAAGETLLKTDACDLPPGERTLHAMYPLHSGKADSHAYKLLTFLGGIVLALLSAGGAVSYGKKLAGRR